jgi:hypothetical protein
MRKHIIIEEIDGELAIQILQTGYNIIETTIYDPELAQMILQSLEEAQR